MLYSLKQTSKAYHINEPNSRKRVLPEDRVLSGEGVVELNGVFAPALRCLTSLLSAALALVVLSGCVSHLGARIEHAPLPPGAPNPEEIMAELAANDSAVQSFRAKGTFTVESPDLSGAKTFRNGSISFRRPASLSVLGRNDLGMAAFRLTCVGSEFLIEFPASKDEPYYRLEGERFADVPFSVSPSDIAREMFLPESWGELRAREYRLVAFDALKQEATIEIGPKRQPRRRVVVRGPEWVVMRSERLDDDGNVIALCTKGDYRLFEGMRFPAAVEACFPNEATRMTFEMRTIRLNGELKDDDFDIRARAREAGLDVSNAPRKGSPRDHVR